MKRYKYRKTFTFEGKRYNAYGNTEREALTKMIQKKADLESGKIAVNGNMLVREWAEIALSTYKPNASADTVSRIRGRYKNYVYPKIGNMSLKNVKPVQCQEIMNSVSGRSCSLVRKLHQDIAFLFSTAKQNKLIPESPAEYIVVPKSLQGHYTSLSEHEREAFVSVCSGTKRYILFELMLFCGCRSTEAMHCKGSDVFLDGETAMLHIRGTKTANADRIVPMPHCLHDKIKDTDSDSYIALTRRGCRYSDSSYKSAAKSLKRAINIEMGCKTYRKALIPPYPLRESFTPYDLRHTYCTDLARRGVDIRIAQKLMGHASIKMTADIYTHIQQEHIIADAKRILGE